MLTVTSARATARPCANRSFAVAPKPRLRVKTAFMGEQVELYSNGEQVLLLCSLHMCIAASGTAVCTAVPATGCCTKTCCYTV
jgi:hypothetical protein